VARANDGERGIDPADPGRTGPARVFASWLSRTARSGGLEPGIAHLFSSHAGSCSGYFTDTCRLLAQGRSLSGLRAAQMCLIRSAAPAPAASPAPAALRLAGHRPKPLTRPVVPAEWRWADTVTCGPTRASTRLQGKRQGWWHTIVAQPAAAGAADGPLRWDRHSCPDRDVELWRPTYPGGQGRWYLCEEHGGLVPHRASVNGRGCRRDRVVPG
jgi:hypothetical protein